MTPGIYCGIGSTGDVDGNKCPAGSFCPNPNNLTACWKDYYCNEGVTAPTPCPSGTYASAGSSQVLQCSDKGSLCAPGQFGTIGSTCKTCPAGSFCVDKSNAAVLCAPGTYNGQAGASVCRVCTEPGTFCPAGSVSPVVCPAGNYCPPCLNGGFCNATACPAGTNHYYSKQNCVSPLHHL